MHKDIVAYEPRPIRSHDELEAVRFSLSDADFDESKVIDLDENGYMVASRERRRLLARPLNSLPAAEIIKRNLMWSRKKRREAELESARYARIVAVIPAFEQEADIDQSIESLLLQSRPIDHIVVVVNGPGKSKAAVNRLRWLNEAFPGQLTVAIPSALNGCDAAGKSKGSKVGALNWAYQQFVAKGSYDFMLGMDADVVADENMVHNLEADMLKQARAGGVRARYSFKTPSDTKSKTMSLVYGQRHEFTKKELDDALHGRAHILGGQATLFEVAALREVAQVSAGYVPWSQDTLVEDAELTRSLEKLGYAPGVSSTARAWTGLMFNARSWQRQRRKWQDGHLTDMTRDFHPWQDRRRWTEQLALGWNLVLRILFAVVVAASVALDQFQFSPLWLIPLGIVTLQSLLIALKTPDRSLREILRAVLYVPGEVYYLRTLSIWIDSVITVSLNIRRDGWANQVAAESGQKKTAVSGWIIILTAVALPVAILLVAERFISPTVMSGIMQYGWIAVTIMTVFSTLVMLRFILRVVRRWKTLNP